MTEFEPTASEIAVYNDFVNKTWSEARDIVDGDPADRYLKGFSIELDAELRQHLRFHPCIKVTHDDEEIFGPAMVATVYDTFGNLCNLICFFLEYDGEPRSLPKFRVPLLEWLPENATIRLGPHSGKCGMAQDIPDAIGAFRATGIPCFVPLDGEFGLGKPKDIKEVVLFPSRAGDPNWLANVIQIYIINETEFSVLYPVNGLPFWDSVLIKGEPNRMKPNASARKVRVE